MSKFEAVMQDRKKLANWERIPSYRMDETEECGIPLTDLVEWAKIQGVDPAAVFVVARDYDGDYEEPDVIAVREETEEEAAQRKLEAAAAQRQRAERWEAQERAEYERLKKKFGNE